MADLPHFLVYVGTVVFALPWALWRVKWHWLDPGRWAWLLIAAATVTYVAFAVNWVRWSLYAGLFMTVVLADLVVSVDAALDRRFGFPVRMPIKVLAVLVLVMGPFAAGAAGIYGGAKPGGGDTAGGTEAGAAGDPRRCPVQAMAGVLGKPPWGDRARTILTSANDGAELLYRTRHRVIGTLHHPNADAILDSVRMLGGIDEARILALIRKRQVDLILICLGSSGEAYGKHGLFQRLKTGQAPPWLNEVSLPGPLGKAFRLFEVAGKSDNS